MKQILPIFLLLFATAAYAADPPVMTWEDNFGGVHYTNDEEAIPALYLDRVEYVRLVGCDCCSSRYGIAHTGPTEIYETNISCSSLTILIGQVTTVTWV